MSDTGHLKCPRCGKELTASAPEGLCPACLAGLNFATETNLSGADLKEALTPMTPAELAPHFPQLEILECLGRGGMGVVYKARQKSLNRLVALKLLAPERVQDAKFAARFEKEAQALALLNHPNIVTVHDFGQAGGFYFLLMEFVDGVNLRQLLRSRKLQPAEALAIVPPVCEALQYAHEHGIVHRDIKPENLLLAKDGRVKIADFGIAKMLGEGPLSAEARPATGGEGEETQAEVTGATQQTTMGTPQYMAPEQREQPQAADHRADIYSLGVVLYELLTGELPADKLQPPSRKVQIDVRLDEIVLRALEKTPELRYQTAGEFKTQVEMVGEKGREQELPAQEDITPAKSGPIPRELKVIAGWMMVQGGLALVNSIFAFISWGQIFLNLLVLHLLIGFGLLSLKAGWWRAAVALNGIQLFASMAGVPLVLFAGSTAGNMLSPGENFREQPVVVGVMVLIQCVLVIACALVHFTLMRLRREGWFGPVSSKHGTAAFPVAVVVFYAGVILGILLIGVLSFRFNRDSAYLLLVGIMAVVSPFVGVMTGNALRQVEQSKDQRGIGRIKGRLKALSIVARILAVPVVGFAVFFFMGMLSERGSWNPATSEAVIVPLTWLGAVLLPWAGMRLWRAASQAGIDFQPKKTDGRGVFLWVAGALLVVFLLAGLALLSSNARRVAEAQSAARAAAERGARRGIEEGMVRTNHAPASQTTSNLVSAPDRSVASTHTVVVPTKFAFPVWLILGVLLLGGLFIGGVVLMVWLARKNGVKGCLVGGLVVGAVMLAVVLLVMLAYWGFSVREVRQGSQPVTTLELSSINPNSPPATSTGLAVQVQNGFNLKVPPGQLVTFEVFIRHGDDRREPVPSLTAVVATDEGDGINTWLSWMGRREDDGLGTNQLWSWSVNGNVLGAVPMPNRTDYGTNMAWQVKPREVLNWWQLALPKSLTMNAGSIQEIALFRTFGSATTDPAQPKEIIARIKRHTLPEEMKMQVGQYQMLLGLEAFERVDAWNQKAGIGVKRTVESAVPTPLVSKEMVEQAHKDYETAKLLMEAGRATSGEAVDAEKHLKWAEAMYRGDVRAALEAKRDGVAKKYERLKLLAGDRLPRSELAKAARELAEAEAALKQFDLKEAK